MGALFGPLMLTWFSVLAVLGIWHIAQAPAVLAAINPMYAYGFFLANGWEGFLILGTVFLVVTGGEALYADIGHFGVFPIRVSWYGVVFPSLCLNYFGQGSLLLRDPSAAVHPLFHMAPEWALYPMIAIATLAAVMASQAVITGSFSLTLQAIQLGYCPRLRIEHTSHEQIRSDLYSGGEPHADVREHCAGAGVSLLEQAGGRIRHRYHVTMVITTLLFFLLVRDHWKWHPVVAPGVAGFFLRFDLAFFGANLPR